MNKNVKQEKLKLWKKQQAELEEQLSLAMVKKGEAAQEGDLRENAKYQDAAEQADLLSARLNNIQKMIKELEQNG
ncbi:MAG: hypothetical protein HYW45_01410 [Candidatus Daviesbacteria bacterium]|nr:MAG: hypothetical protein HYW45_01410 [Candidatus Daviesbacteria bacterium]